jgi:SAM-dependent methyltransferase
MMRLPAYPRILYKLRDEGSQLLDVGCCVAQDLRRFVFDGAPAAALCGAELQADFLDVGYELFRDRDTLRARFVRGDVLDPDPDAPLNRMAGAMDVGHLSMILHCFEWDDQLRALERCVRILQPVPGGLIVGQAVGHAQGVRSAAHEGRFSFKHSDVTFKKLVLELEERTGVKFQVRAELDEGLYVANGERKWDDHKSRRLVFEVEKL